MVQFHARDIARAFPIRPHAAIAAELDRGQRPIGLYADFVILLGRPAAVHRDEIFLARELQFYRRAGLLRQHGDHQIGILALIFVAESAAHVLADHAHVLERQVQIARDFHAAVRNALGGRIDGKLVAFPLRHSGSNFKLRIVEMNGGVVVFEDLIRFGEAFVDVAVAVRFRLMLALVVG